VTTAFADYIAPLLPLLNRDDVTDVMLNEPARPGEPGPVFADVVGQGLVQTDVTMGATQAELLVRKVAQAKRQELTTNLPIMSAMHVLPDGTRWRFEASIPPASIATTITIRKYLKRDVWLADYRGPGGMSHAQCEALVEAMAERRVVLIAGATGDGKSTLTNALLREAGGDGRRRVLVAEAEPELERPHLLSTMRQVCEGTAFDTRAAIEHAMRSLPSMVVVGELRTGPAAVECVKAWRTGHGGMTTLHAPSVTEAMWRLYDLVQEGSTSSVEPAYVARSVDLVVHVKREQGRRVFTVARCRGWSGTDFTMEAVT
jgi:type IV secretion system protein VirB11